MTIFTFAFIPSVVARPLFAEASATPLGWALVGFCIILGLMVTLGPSRRTTEIKKPND